MTTALVIFALTYLAIGIQRLPGLHVDRPSGALMGAVAMVGVGLVTLTTPMAMVMFPKLVNSLAKGQKTDSFLLAMAGTALLGGFAALVCTIFPELPLRVLYFNRPEFWVSAQLVPWFMWCMLPVPVANVSNARFCPCRIACTARLIAIS